MWIGHNWRLKMKKILSFVFALLFSISCFGQSSTPNLGFQIPATGSNNWYIPLNYNFTKLDLFLSGNLALPGLSVTGNATISGTVTANSFVGLGGAGFATSPGALQYSVPYFFSPGTTSNIGGIALNGIPYFSSTAPPRIATVNDLNVLMRISPGCSTPLYLFSPQSNQCYPATTSYFPGASTVTVSGAPTTGQVLTATGTSAANWQNGVTSYFPGSSTVTISGAPTGSGQQLVSTSSSAANWQMPSTGIRPFDTCNSFGDSTTYGLDAVSRYASYPSVVSTHINVNCLNQGVSGITSNGLDATLLAATLPATVKGLNTYMIGTNNVTAGGSDTNQLANFSTNVLAQYALLAIPPTSRISASTFTYTGSWSTGTYTSSRKSTTSGNTATFSVTGTTILLATTLQATFTNGGTATLTCDGTPTGVTLQFAGSGSANIVAGSQTGLNVVTGLTNTTHSCVVAVTSSSPGIVDVVWAAGLSGASQPTFPHEIAISLFDRNPTDANTPNYRAAEAAAVTQLQSYGLSNLQYVSEAGVLTAPSNYNDTLHPSEYGYYLGAQPVIADIDALAIVTPTLPNQVYYGAFLTNNTQASGGQNLFFGFGNGLSLTTGSFNMGGGFGAGEALTSGGNNTLLGWSAASLATTSAGVTGIGADVFQNLTTGSNNTCAGTQSGKLLTTGGNNTCMGFGALDAATTAAANTALGYGSLSSITTGPNNIGIGSGAGQSNNVAANVVTIGVNDIMIGTNTGQSVTSATATTGAIAIGSSALFGGSGAVEIGNGTCATANTFCYQGFQFLTSTGAGTFSNLSTTGSITSAVNGTFSGTVIAGTFATSGSNALNASGTATSGGNFSSGTQQFNGSYWNGSAASVDTWQWQNVIGSGTNPTSTLLLTHPTGTSGGSTITVDVPLLATKFGSQNCASSTTPAVCGSNSVGSITMPVGATTIVVDTSAITAISQIFIQPDTSINLSSITCNTTATQFAGPYYISARTIGTSFTITSLGTAPAVNPACLSFNIIN